MNPLFAKLRVLPAEQDWDGPMQMAVDEALLETAVLPTLRFFKWSRPQATFGYFESLDAIRRAARYPDLLTRRWTGGGLVEHGEDLTFSIIVPAADPAFNLRGRDFYEAVHRAVAAALGEEGIATAFASAQAKDAKALPCFQAPVDRDLLLAEAGHPSTLKVLGGAMRRARHGLLYQGSLQATTDDSTRFSLTDRIPRHLSPHCQPDSLPPPELSRARHFAITKYSAAAWLKRTGAAICDRG